MTDVFPARTCEQPGPEPCPWMAELADDDAPEGAARCYWHAHPERPGTGSVFDAPDPDRAPRLAQGVAWVREGEEAELDGRLYLPRTPRGPRDPL